MPIYEYHCSDCSAGFELLRPVREAANSQPCPQCDADAERVISRQWAAFTYRAGYSRSLPDDGGYLHMGKKVSAPISYSSDGASHPELQKPEATPQPTIADVEEYEAISEYKLQREREFGGRVSSGTLGQARREKENSLRPTGGNRVDRQKRLAVRKVRQEERQAHLDVEREVRGRIRAAEKRVKSEIPPEE